MMTDTIQRWLQSVDALADQYALRNILFPIGDRMSSCALSTAGLVIKAGGSALTKTGAADSYYIANGVLVKIASGTDMPALVGSITAAKFNVFMFFIDSAAVVTAAMGTEGAAIANVKFPPIPLNKAIVGFLIVTHSSTFVGGTTALDTATTVYQSPIGAFDPTIITG